MYSRARMEEEVKRFPADVRRLVFASWKDWDDFHNAMYYADRFLAWGKPGSGKSTSACKVGIGERSVVRTLITAETCRPEVLGHWSPSASGDLKWLDGPGIKAWREGSRLVVDEMDEAGGDTIPALHALADDTDIAHITLGNGERISPKEGFQFFATMNSDPVQSLTPALFDRFVIKRRIDLPNPEVLFTLPNEVRLSAAYALYSPHPKPGMGAQLTTTRSWIELGRLISKKGLSLRGALSVLGADERVEKAITAAHVKLDETLAIA